MVSWLLNLRFVWHVRRDLASCKLSSLRFPIGINRLVELVRFYNQFVEDLVADAVRILRQRPHVHVVDRLLQSVMIEGMRRRLRSNFIKTDLEDVSEAFVSAAEDHHPVIDFVSNSVDPKHFGAHLQFEVFI